MNEHLLYTRLYLVTGDAEVNWALSLVLICTKEAYQLVNLVLDPSLETNPPPKCLARYLGPRQCLYMAAG